MDFREIERRLLVVEKALAQLGVSLGESLESWDRAPAATCIHTGVVVEHILRDLWRRLKLKGPSERRQLEDLLTATAKKMEEDGTPIPRRIHDHMRGLQLTRNRAAHYWDATREDAQDCLWKLSDVAHWYFVTFLPSYEHGAGGSVAKGSGRGDAEAAGASSLCETKTQEERYPQVNVDQPPLEEHGQSELAAEPKKQPNEFGSSAITEKSVVDRIESLYLDLGGEGSTAITEKSVVDRGSTSPPLPAPPQDALGAGALETGPAGDVPRQQETLVWPNTRPTAKGIATIKDCKHATTERSPRHYTSTEYARGFGLRN